MSRSRTVVATLATISLFAGSIFVASANADPVSVTLSATRTMTTVSIRGCEITIEATNSSQNNVVVDLDNSESKVRNGLWSRMRSTNWTVNTGGGRESKVFEADMGCNFDRQYKFRMRSSGNERSITFPANGDFTGARTLNLGNVGRHF